jgi:hypothetical protein
MKLSRRQRLFFFGALIVLLDIAWFVLSVLLISPQARPWAAVVLLLLLLWPLLMRRNWKWWPWIEGHGPQGRE